MCNQINMSRRHAVTQLSTWGKKVSSSLFYLYQSDGSSLCTLTKTGPRAQFREERGGDKYSFTALKQSVIHEGEVQMNATKPNFPTKPRHWPPTFSSGVI